MFPNQAKRDTFHEWLKDEIPLGASVSYATHWDGIPSCMEGQEDSVPPGFVHISAFSFDDDCGLTGPVEMSKCDTMLNLMVTSGFLTSEEPIRIRWPRVATCLHYTMLVSAHTASLLQVSEEARSKTVLEPGSLYFLKGQARTLSVMALLACIMKRGQHVKDAAWLLVTLGC